MMIALELCIGGNQGLAGPACDGFDHYGTYDVGSGRTDVEQGLSLRNWVCSRNFARPEALTAAAVQIGLIVQDMPAALGYSPMPRLPNFAQWQIDYCTKPAPDPMDARHLLDLVRSTTSGVRDQIARCLAEPGPHIIAEQRADPHQISFGLSYRPSSNEDPPIIRAFGFGVDQKHFTCVPMQLTNLALPPDKIGVICTRQSRFAVRAWLDISPPAPAATRKDALSFSYIWWSAWTIEQIMHTL